MTKPIIGITADITTELEHNEIKLRRRYADSITAAGCIPVILATAIETGDIASVAKRLDGLLFMGGADIDPARYGKVRSEKCGVPKPERDTFELELMRYAMTVNMPTLAICRGSQVMNVACGGTLIEDIESELGVPACRHSQPEDYSVVTHGIAVEPNSLLRSITGLDAFTVNSKHHQCVDDLGNGLVVDARSAEDGIIEAFHAPELRFFLGVQWHPEMLAAARPEAAALFAALASAAR